MKLSIFGVLEEENYSNQRYARELAAHLPEGARNYSGHFDGLSQSVFDVFAKYPLRARRLQGDANLIVSTVYSHLLPFLNRNTVIVCHDVHPLLFQGQQGLHNLRFQANLRLLPKAKFIVAVSETTRTELFQFCHFIPAEKVITVHSGLGPGWRPLPEPTRLAEFRKQHGLESRPFILNVGSDSWYKNFSSLLRAFALLKEKDLILVKVGKISLQERRLIAELKIQERVIHFAQLNDDPLLLLYNCAEMLVFPSLHEGFGWPPLEAMACGCPVIAGNRPSLPEICGDAALYVDPERPSEIAAAVARLRAEPETRNILKRKGIEQSSKYDWKKTAESILALFNL